LPLAVLANTERPITSILLRFIGAVEGDVPLRDDACSPDGRRRDTPLDDTPNLVLSFVTGSSDAPLDGPARDEPRFSVAGALSFVSAEQPARGEEPS
jgi:hypothetical protein